MEGNSEQVRIKGILVPVAWDADGNVTKAAVATFNEEEYVVEEDEKGKRLLSLMQQVVEVSGVVKKEAGNKIITVENFEQPKRARHWE
jgi:non-canonical (house-cleaning) NTP pyrophosphatase